MKIEITGWSCKGIRAADMDIDLTQNKSKAVSKLSLILLGNGGGKTTTSELIRDTLSGRTQKYSAEDVAHYAGENSKNSTGTFQVDIRLDDVEYNFINNFNLYLGLDELNNLFNDNSFLISFWVHFLAINLFCGSWIVKDSQKFAISKIIVFFPLAITYFIGPFGLFMYWFIRIFFAKKISFND